MVLQLALNINVTISPHCPFTPLLGMMGAGHKWPNSHAPWPDIPIWEWWSMEQHKDTCTSFTVGAALEHSTWHTYTSALTVYTNFVTFTNSPWAYHWHTWFFFHHLQYMSYHIKLSPVKSYLSSVCSELKLIWCDIHSICLFLPFMKSLLDAKNWLGHSFSESKLLQNKTWGPFMFHYPCTPLMMIGFGTHLEGHWVQLMRPHGQANIPAISDLGLGGMECVQLLSWTKVSS